MPSQKFWKKWASDPPRMTTPYATDPETIAAAHAHCPEALVSFSSGKDSIAAWLALRDCKPAFTRVVAFYMYLVPDLEFVEDGLTYYERVFGTRILRVPHPSLYRWLNAMTFCPPQRCRYIERMRLPDFTYQQLADFLRDDEHLSPSSLCAVGTRKADSIARRRMFARHGTIHARRKIVYPVAHHKIDDVIALLRRHDIRLPVDYRLFGRSFDGLDARFLIPIRDHFPRDYARILEWFPLAELEVFRREHA